MKIIAHRGLWKAPGATENSLKAFEAAVIARLRGVETDVRMSADGKLYLFHDPIIQGLEIDSAHSLLLDEMRLDNGEIIPRFEQFLDIVKYQKRLKLYIEFKTGPGEAYKRRMVMQAVEELNEFRVLSRCIFLSFDMEILEICREIAPKVPLMFLVEDMEFDLEEIRQKKFPFMGIDIELIKTQPDLIKKVRKSGMKVNVWTVNHPEEMALLKGQRVYSITTDFPNQINK